MTAFFAIQRVMGGWWQLPADPLDPASWEQFHPENWSMVVAPESIANDTSPLAVVHSRFKSIHDCTKKVVEDAQLTWTFRRYLPGDAPPWPGARLRPGCLVIDLVDKSAAYQETSFSGDLATGLVRQFVHVEPDGVTESIRTIADPAMPSEYSDPNFLGTVASAPWVIYRDGTHTGIQQSEFVYRPATDVRIVGGGNSMPGINEGLSAAIRLGGALVAAVVPGLPDLGSVADALLEPIYSNVLGAFSAQEVPGRRNRLGWSTYQEKWAESSDRAYTIQWLLSVRAAKWSTRQQISHEVVVADGAPYRIGQRGFGHFYVGDRVGTTVRGMPPGQVFVDQVTEVALTWDRDTAPTWKITIGQRDEKDPVVQAWERLQEILGILQDLGVL
ncbi:phage tail protein [Nocardia puris]|nr:phage tail protein [Nocardia puris]